MNIAERTTNKTVKLASGPLATSRDKFKKALQEVRRQEKKHAKELRERDEAVAMLTTKYDSSRSVTLMYSPQADVGETSSNYTTPDDKIQAAEDLEELLLDEVGVDETHPADGEGDAAPTGSKWALELLKDLSPLITKATKENTEAMQASEDLQNAVTAHAETRGGLEYQIQAFRQVVRNELGKKSKEYDALRLRTRASSSDKEEELNEFDDPNLGADDLDEDELEEPEETETTEETVEPS
jgi:hypothetical protein